MRLYLAGPMTGRPEFNYPAFREAARLLRRRPPGGNVETIDVVSPVELDEAEGHDPQRDGAQSHRDYMGRCLPAVLSCEAIALMDGWAASRGAVCEVVVAITAGLQVYTLDVVPAGGELLPRDHAWVWARIAAKVAAGDHGRTRRRDDDVKLIEDLPRGILATGGTIPDARARELVERAKAERADEALAEVTFTSRPERIERIAEVTFTGRPDLIERIAEAGHQILTDEEQVRRLVAVPEPPPAESVLQEAERLVNGPRQDAYGHPYDDFSRTGRLWGAILGTDDVPPATVGLMMAALKISREVNRPGRDNLTDLAGYAGTVELVRQREAEGRVGAVESAA